LQYFFKQKYNVSLKSEETDIFRFPILFPMFLFDWHNINNQLWILEIKSKNPKLEIKFSLDFCDKDTESVPLILFEYYIFDRIRFGPYSCYPKFETIVSIDPEICEELPVKKEKVTLIYFDKNYQKYCNHEKTGLPVCIILNLLQFCPQLKYICKQFYCLAHKYKICPKKEYILINHRTTLTFSQLIRLNEKIKNRSAISIYD